MLLNLSPEVKSCENLIVQARKTRPSLIKVHHQNRRGYPININKLSYYLIIFIYCSHVSVYSLFLQLKKKRNQQEIKIIKKNQRTESEKSRHSLIIVLHTNSIYIMKYHSQNVFQY